jgi:hypothetical protein
MLTRRAPGLEGKQRPSPEASTLPMTGRDLQIKRSCPVGPAASMSSKPDARARPSERCGPCNRAAGERRDSGGYDIRCRLTRSWGDWQAVLGTRRLGEPENEHPRPTSGLVRVAARATGQLGRDETVADMADRRAGLADPEYGHRLGSERLSRSSQGGDRGVGAVGGVVVVLGPVQGLTLPRCSEVVAWPCSRRRSSSPKTTRTIGSICASEQCSSTLG